jgi:transposase
MLIYFVTEVSVSSLKRIIKEGQQSSGLFSTPGKKRPHLATVSNLDSFDLQTIRNKVNEFYIVKKQIPTLRTLLANLKENMGFVGCRETLRKILLSNGFEFKQNKNERSVLIERYDIAAWRQKFLRTIAAKRADNKPIIYTDETYVHQNYKPKKSWQGPSTSGVIENISSGKRFIIVHAGSENGFVPNALLTFSTKSTKADYHHDMNSTNFNRWLQEKLIPNLSGPSVIVFDNASYHTVQMNKSPNTNTRKADIQAWLRANSVNFEEYLYKEELLVLVNQHKTEPIYEADEILRAHGHEVLRLPPYHCDLNPIELIWSTVKRKVGGKNVGRSAKELEEIIKECFDSITSSEWKKMTDHVLHVENQYKEKDGITDQMESFIISVRDGDSSSSDESTEVIYEAEYLEFDYSE